MRRLLSWTGAATDLYVSGQNSDTIYQVNPSTGAIIGAAPTNGDASGICFDDSSRLYVVDYTNMEVDEFNTSTGANLGKFASPFMLGYGLAYGDGQFFLADRAGSVDVYHSNGAQNVMILSDDPNYDPISALVTPSDKLLVGTYSGTQIDESNLDGSSPTVFVSNSLIGTGYGLAFGPNGNLYESNGAANKILEFDGSTGGYITSITGGGLDFPLGITFGPDGTLYVANNGNNTISTFNGTTGAAKSVFTGFGGVYAMAFQPAAFADHLVFSTEPSNTGAGQTIGGGGGVQVTIEDQSDQVVTSSDIINLSLGTNPTSATLGGTTSATAINGVATFNNLSISKLASGYTLTATDTTTTSTTDKSTTAPAVPAAGN